MIVVTKCSRLLCTKVTKAVYYEVEKETGGYEHEI